MQVLIDGNDANMVHERGHPKSWGSTPSFSDQRKLGTYNIYNHMNGFNIPFVSNETNNDDIESQPPIIDTNPLYTYWRVLNNQANVGNYNAAPFNSPLVGSSVMQSGAHVWRISNLQFFDLHGNEITLQGTPFSSLDSEIVGYESSKAFDGDPNTTSWSSREIGNLYTAASNWNGIPLPGVWDSNSQMDEATINATYPTGTMYPGMSSIGFNFESPVSVHAIRINQVSPFNSSNIIIQGSNDGLSWYNVFESPALAADPLDTSYEIAFTPAYDNIHKPLEAVPEPPADQKTSKFSLESFGKSGNSKMPVTIQPKSTIVKYLIFSNVK